MSTKNWPKELTVSSLAREFQRRWESIAQSEPCVWHLPSDPYIRRRYFQKLSAQVLNQVWHDLVHMGFKPSRMRYRTSDTLDRDIYNAHQWVTCTHDYMAPWWSYLSKSDKYMAKKLAFVFLNFVNQDIPWPEGEE